MKAPTMLSGYLPDTENVASKITLTRSSTGTNAGTATLQAATRYGNIVVVRVALNGMTTTSSTKWNNWTVSTTLSVGRTICGYPSLSSQNDGGKVQSLRFDNVSIQVLMSSAQTANAITIISLWFLE